MPNKQKSPHSVPFVTLAEAAQLELPQLTPFRGGETIVRVLRATTFTVCVGVPFIILAPLPFLAACWAIQGLPEVAAGDVLLDVAESLQFVFAVATEMGMHI